MFVTKASCQYVESGTIPQMQDGGNILFLAQLMCPGKEAAQNFGVLPGVTSLLFEGEPMQQGIKNFLVAALAVMVAACGGGGSADNNAGPSEGGIQQYRVFDGNANQHVVLDGASTQFAVRKSDDRMVHLSSGSALNGLLFSEGGHVSRDGQKIGAIIITAGQGGKNIATLTCTGPAPNYGAMTITVTAQSWTHSCASNTGSSGSSQPGSSVPEYVSWNGSSNGKMVLDGSNRQFGVNQSTRVVHDFQTNVALNGLTVEGVSVYVQGNSVGSVILTESESNSNVAVFRCGNGNNLQITQTPGKWSYNCGNGGSVPTTPGGATGSGNNPPDPASVVNWALVNSGALPGNPFSRYQVTVGNIGNVRISCQVNISYEAIDSSDGIIRPFNRTLSAGPIAVGAAADMVLALGDRNFTFKRINSLSCIRWPFD